MNRAMSVDFYFSFECRLFAAPNLMHAEIFRINGMGECVCVCDCVFFTFELMLKIFYVLMPNFQ